MISELIIDTCRSEKSRSNFITDGEFECAYKDLPNVFDKIDRYFDDNKVSNESFLAYGCSNNTFGAMLLLWALSRERKILLLPPPGAHGKDKNEGVDAPHFCQHIISINIANEADLTIPSTFLRISTNFSYDVKSVFSTPNSLVF